MATIVIAGLINLETTVQVEQFPIEYTPVRYPFFGVRSAIAGVGYNLAKALTTLGDQVRLATLIGRDQAGALAERQLRDDAIAREFALARLSATPQSAILFDASGRRQINVDLKDIQDQTYPAEQFERAIAGCDLAALCNINFARPLLDRARARGIPIATDVHAIADIDDAYNRDFMAAADILFMSHECLPAEPERWVEQLQARYAAPLIVIGLGAAGALLAVRGDRFVGRFPAASPRPVVSTIGAGDALFAAFLHGYAATGDPYDSIRRAITFAGYKVGVAGAADGFLGVAALDALHAEL